MTKRIFLARRGRIEPHRWCTAAVALVIATSAVNAHADAGATANIPGPEPESEVPSELAAPYEPWQGAGYASPQPAPATDLPPPLARPRALPRRPVELTAALAAFLPSCGSGSLDDRACQTIAPGSGADAALLYRVTPYFAFGAEAALSGFGARGGGLLSSAGGGARFVGAAGRVYFTDSGVWDPYVSLTFGIGSLTLRGGAVEDAHVTTSGFGARVSGGVDYVLGSHLRLGPTVSFSRWLAWSEQQCQASICGPAPAVYGRVLGFATLGLRVTASFGDVL